MRRAFIRATAALAAMGLAAKAAAQAAPAAAGKGGRVKVVYQLSEGTDQAVRAMANLRNHLNAAPDTKIVVVAFGYGVDFIVQGARDARGNTFEAAVGALEMIKAHPHKRVLVAGHTDAAGNPRSNLKLSEARAASVRDWLADAAGLPPTRFAIQGYGDTRPKAANDTDAGRAANRRVEITLVPDCRDGDRDNRTTLGHPACSFQ